MAPRSLARLEERNDGTHAAVVVALGLFAVSGSRGFSGLEVGTLLAGFWLILSPYILDTKFAIATPMYWSNVFAGALIAVVGLAALAETRRLSAR